MLATPNDRPMPMISNARRCPVGVGNANPSRLFEIPEQRFTWLMFASLLDYLPILAAADASDF